MAGRVLFLAVVEDCDFAAVESFNSEVPRYLFSSDLGRYLGLGLSMRADMLFLQSEVGQSTRLSRAGEGTVRESEP